MEHTVQERNVKPRLILSVRLTALDEELPARIKAGLVELGKYLDRMRVEPYGPPVAVYRASGHGLNDVEVGYPVAEPVRGEGRFTLSQTPGGPVAWTRHVGPHGELPLAYQAISVWAAEHDRRLAGPAWESYLSSPEQVTDPGRLETEVFWPLAMEEQ
jgi:effector-binding domain-containing protein